MIGDFFITGELPANIEVGSYQLPLVILSYLVASFASYTAIDLAQQLVNAKGRIEKRLLHWGGALALGAGIWSMHFIGMLSYKMRMVMDYDLSLTLLSMVLAIAASFVALGVVARPKLTMNQIFIGALLMGVGICGMHYFGMAAMQMDASLRYIPGIFLLSIAIAVVGSGCGLWVAFTLARSHSAHRYLYQLAAAMVLGAAIFGMHYTGMLASVFIPFANCRYDPNQNFNNLAIAVAGITGFILFLALATGIYRKAQTEARLQNSEGKLRAIFDSALDAIIGMDHNGIITEWNHQAEVIFGWSQQNAIGKNFVQLVIPATQQDMHPINLNSLITNTGESIIGKRIEVEALKSDGERFPLELTVAAQKLQNNYFHFNAFARDITSRKLAEKSTAWLAAIVRSSDDAIISKTLDGIITSWNSSAERMFGYSAHEAIGKHINLIIPDDRIPEEIAIISRLRSGKSIDHFETVRVRKDGSFINLSLTISPIYDTAGNIIGASKIARDITDHIEALQAIHDANRKKDEFMANMSHELRTPMNAVIGLANILQRSAPLTEKQAQYIDTLRTSADNLLDLINNLLDFSKLDSNSLKFENIEFALSEIVSRVVSMLSVKAKEKALALEVAINCDHYQHYLGDPVRLQQILVNLLSNAIKFTEHGYVKLTVDCHHKDAENSTLIFKVEDTGIGIPADKQSLIFEKFSQVDASITRKYGGSGLGLTISKNIVEKMGGRINVSSTAGAGSTFTVELPFKNSGTISQSEKLEKENTVIPVGEKHILLVEDHEPNIMVTGVLLSELGYTYDAVNSGKAAIQKFQATHYDAVLMDIQMHEMDGFEATRHIRQYEETRGMKPTPIIAMTAHAMEKDRIKCFEVGMNDFISKPFHPDKFYEVLQRLVN